MNDANECNTQCLYCQNSYCKVAICSTVLKDVLLIKNDVEVFDDFELFNRKTVSTGKCRQKAKGTSRKQAFDHKGTQKNLAVLNQDLKTSACILILK